MHYLWLNKNILKPTYYAVQYPEKGYANEINLMFDNLVRATIT